MNSFTFVAGLMDESSVRADNDDRTLGFERGNGFIDSSEGAGGGLAVMVS